MADASGPCQQQKQSRIARRDATALLIILVLAALVMLPIFLKHFPQGHDAPWHYRWASGFINALREGSPYPRWHTEANFGQGSPVMLYYPPLPFYVVAAFSIFVTEPIIAIKLSCLLALFISGVTMYAFCRSIFSSSASLLASAFYMLAPYHLFDLYTRSALSEFWAFAWVPLLLHAVWRACREDNTRAVSYLAISYALLMLTHAPILVAVSLILPICALCVTRNVGRLIRLAAGLALGAGLGVIYAVPVIFEGKYVNLNLVLRFSKDYFLFRHLGSVFNSPLFASEDTPEVFITNPNWMALGLLLLFAVASLLIWGKSGERVGFDAVSRRAIWIVTALSLLTTTRISMPLWKVVPGFSVLQIPTRWLLIVSAGVSIFVAAAASVVFRAGKRRFVYASIFAAAVIFNLTISALTVARTPLEERWYKGRQLLSIEAREYHPVWWDGQRHEELEASPVIVDSGDAGVSAIDYDGRTAELYGQREHKVVA
jgi:uncharacterized membrane protein